MITRYIAAAATPLRRYADMRVMPEALLMLMRAMALIRYAPLLLRRSKAEQK